MRILRITDFSVDLECGVFTECELQCGDCGFFVWEWEWDDNEDVLRSYALARSRRWTICSLSPVSSSTLVMVMG